MIYCPTCSTPLLLTWRGSHARSECTCCHALWHLDIRCLRESGLPSDVIREKANKWRPDTTPQKVIGE